MQREERCLGAAVRSESVLLWPVRPPLSRCSPNERKIFTFCRGFREQCPIFGGGGRHEEKDWVRFCEQRVLCGDEAIHR
ncbi:hypothetical protein TNCV_4428221 [Trichonephila clavipes]|nr:hypothetical protein TNCV_4428221 [Trichonephila clavipes]